MTDQPITSFANNKIFENKKGKIFLELSKTYKGDKRFKLDEDF